MKRKVASFRAAPHGLVREPWQHSSRRRNTIASRIREICINCADPDAMATFWSAALGFLSAAESELDLRAYKALHFEKLVGDRAGRHSIRLNRQWRLIVRIETDPNGQLLIIVEIVDYH